MIDLHHHILPGIDDGPATMEAAVELGRAAVAGGIHLVVATPHLRADFPRVHTDELRRRCEALNIALEAAGVELPVLPGGEVDLIWAESVDPEHLRLATVGQNGTDVLLETPYGALPPDFGARVLAIAARGLRVLLAHPERNPSIQRDPQIVWELVQRGVLVQITASSLMRTERASRTRRTAQWLLEHDAAHVIASDAHAAGAWRGPELREAVKAAIATDPGRAAWMAHEVPQAIVAGEPLPPDPWRHAESRRPRWRGRQR